MGGNSSKGPKGPSSEKEDEIFNKSTVETILLSGKIEKECQQLMDQVATLIDNSLDIFQNEEEKVEGMLLVMEYLQENMNQLNPSASPASANPAKMRTPPVFTTLGELLKQRNQTKAKEYIKRLYDEKKVKQRRTENGQRKEMAIQLKIVRIRLKCQQIMSALIEKIEASSGIFSSEEEKFEGMLIILTYLDEKVFKISYADPGSIQIPPVIYTLEALMKEDDLVFHSYILYLYRKAFSIKDSEDYLKWKEQFLDKLPNLSKPSSSSIADKDKESSRPTDEFTNENIETEKLLIFEKIQSDCMRTIDDIAEIVMDINPNEEAKLGGMLVAVDRLREELNQLDPYNTTTFPRVFINLDSLLKQRRKEDIIEYLMEAYPPEESDLGMRDELSRPNINNYSTLTIGNRLQEDDLEQAYILLGLTKSATVSEVNCAYLRNCKVNHPDLVKRRNPSLSKAEMERVTNRFIKVHKAVTLIRSQGTVEAAGY